MIAVWLSTVYNFSAASFKYHLSALQDLLWEPVIKPAPLLVTVVPALPRAAAVELHVTAVQDDITKRTSCHMATKVACGSIECHAVMSADRCSASLTLSLAVPSDDLEVTDVKDVTEALAVTFKKALTKMDTELVPLCARVFYKCGHSPAQQIIKGMSRYHGPQDATLLKMVEYLHSLRGFIPNKQLCSRQHL